MAYGLGDTLNVVTKNLAMTLSAAPIVINDENKGSPLSVISSLEGSKVESYTLSETLSTLSTARHC